MKPYEPVPYTAEGMIDPFRPERIDVAGAGARRAPTPRRSAPELNRPKEPLEAFPLESIQMLGTITQNKETFALVKAGPNLYRVKKGNYMGQNFGVITAIDEAQINLKELVQDAAATGWSARARCNWWRQNDENQSHARCLSGVAALAGRARARRWRRRTASRRSTSREQGGKVVVRITTKEPLQQRAAQLHRRQPGAHRVRLSRTP